MLKSKALVITDAAKRDLAAIARYTKKTWGEKQNKLYISKLQTSFSALCTSNNLGKSYDNLHPSLQATQSQKHMIFYLENHGEVHIVRVLHQSMDFEQHLS